MMGELEILAPLHLRFTINNWDNILYGSRMISVFQLNGRKFLLKYCYAKIDETEYHSILMSKEFGNCRNPIDTSVQVVSSGRVVSGLSARRQLYNTTKSWCHHSIWMAEEFQIRQEVPDFRNHGLTWIIALKESIFRVELMASQTNCSIPEGFEVSCMESLSADFARLMVRGLDPDMVFMCDDQRIEAHRTIVCARSTVIAAMLRSDMVEGTTRVIRIPNAEPDDFKQFLQYLYCGKLDKLTCDLALTLYELGDQYAVLGLVMKCSQFLLEHLNPENVYNVLVIADLHSDEDFVEKIITYMVEATFPHESGQWLAFCENHPKLALQVLREKELVQEKKRRCRKRKLSFRLKQVRPLCN